eukprot:Protomagalhaensia_sp_Gyna_25__1210@NODE_15_length_8331_cov_299_599132_g10_i1_p6_GENE_NODE_15_length_8331_cov_299_599132_g10_i1NODE_15_length_8331_cov_299_599132_g10_i1_p6_ORF_typecomplete_len162_score25_21_NODE_15_length_8331_cov_299_599132_g10_i124492934
MNCVVEFGCLVEIASALESYEPPLHTGLLFGEVPSLSEEADKVIVTGAMSWPLSDPELLLQISERTSHRVLASKKPGFRCIGGYKVGKEVGLPVEAVTLFGLADASSIVLFCVLDPELFVESGPEEGTLALVRKMAGIEVAASVADSIRVWFRDSTVERRT